MTREDKVERMLDAIADWDIDSLIAHVQGTMEENFKLMSNDMLDQEYIDWFGDEADIEEDDDFIAQEQQPKEEQCSCGRMKDIGHKCWWCGA